MIGFPQIIFERRMMLIVVHFSPIFQECYFLDVVTLVSLASGSGSFTGFSAHLHYDSFESISKIFQCLCCRQSPPIHVVKDGTGISQPSMSSQKNQTHVFGLFSTRKQTCTTQ